MSAVGGRILLADAGAKQKVSAICVYVYWLSAPIERRTQCMLLSASFNPEPYSMTSRLMAEA